MLSKKWRETDCDYCGKKLQGENTLQDIDTGEVFCNLACMDKRGEQLADGRQEDLTDQNQSGTMVSS